MSQCSRDTSSPNAPIALRTHRPDEAIPEGVTTYIDADVHRHRDDRSTPNVLDFNEPIAVMVLGILGYVPDFEEARSIVTRVMDAVVPGSYLLVRDYTDSGEAVREAADRYAESGVGPYHLRTVAPAQKVLHRTRDGRGLARKP